MPQPAALPSFGMTLDSEGNSAASRKPTPIGIRGLPASEFLISHRVELSHSPAARPQRGTRLAGGALRLHADKKQKLRDSYHR